MSSPDRTKKKAALLFHRNHTLSVAMQALDLAQRKRGDLLPGREYAKTEAVAFVAVYMAMVDNLQLDEAEQMALLKRGQNLVPRLRDGTEVEVEWADDKPEDGMAPEGS